VKNSYRIDGEIVYVQLCGDRETQIDLADLPLLQAWRGTWTYTTGSKGRPYCAIHAGSRGSQRGYLLHRVLLQAPEGQMVDHRDGDGLNNQRKNLRLVTQSQNMQNRKALNSNNQSGVRNVSWDKYTKSWKVVFRIEGKTKTFGRYKDFTEAARVADAQRSDHQPFQHRE
jgi:hypothetical protein